MSGNKILRLELESQQRCDDKNFMTSFVKIIIQKGNIGESFKNTKYSCCSSSCCSYNSTNINIIGSAIESKANVHVETKQDVTITKSIGKDSTIYLMRLL